MDTAYVTLAVALPTACAMIAAPAPGEIVTTISGVQNWTDLASGTEITPTSVVPTYSARLSRSAAAGVPEPSRCDETQTR